MMHTPVPEADLETLLARALDGDGAAYARFLAAVTPMLRRWALAEMAKSGMASLAEDVVQETLLTVHLKRGSWQAGRPLAPWLRVILRHKAIDVLRRRPGARWQELAEEPPDAAPPDPLAGRQIAQVLARLPQRDAALVRGLAVEGVGEATVAARLGLSDGAMRVALHRALKRIAALVAADETET